MALACRGDRRSGKLRDPITDQMRRLTGRGWVSGILCDTIVALTTDIDARTPILPKSSEIRENNRKSTIEVSDI